MSYLHLYIYLSTISIFFKTFSLYLLLFHQTPNDSIRVLFNCACCYKTFYVYCLAALYEFYELCVNFRECFYGLYILFFIGIVLLMSRDWLRGIQVKPFFKSPY
jgi:hypothetical protein